MALTASGGTAGGGPLFYQQGGPAVYGYDQAVGGTAGNLMPWMENISGAMQAGWNPSAQEMNQLVAGMPSQMFGGFMDQLSQLRGQLNPPTMPAAPTPAPKPYANPYADAANQRNAPGNRGTGS